MSFTESPNNSAVLVLPDLPADVGNFDLNFITHIEKLNKGVICTFREGVILNILLNDEYTQRFYPVSKACAFLQISPFRKKNAPLRILKVLKKLDDSQPGICFPRIVDLHKLEEGLSYPNIRDLKEALTNALVLERWKSRDGLKYRRLHEDNYFHAKRSFAKCFMDFWKRLDA